MRSAIDIARWAIPHAVTAFGWDGVPGEANEVECKAVLAAIGRKGISDWVKLRDLHRAVKNQAWVKQGGAVAVLKAVEQLVEMRWLMAATRPDGSGRDSTFYRPHPSLAGVEDQR
jgi:hypothetical protein